MDRIFKLINNFAERIRINAIDLFVFCTFGIPMYIAVFFYKIFDKDEKDEKDE